MWAVKLVFTEGNEVSEWLPVRVRLRHGCVMLPWLFNMYMDGVVREVNARVLGKGLKLVDGNDNGWDLNQLLWWCVREGSYE